MKGSHGVLRDLIALRDLNRRIGEVGAIAKSQMSTVEHLVEDYLDLLWSDERDEPGPVASDHAAVQQVSDVVHERARDSLGAAYPTYCRLKVEAAARRMADEIALRFVFPPDSSRTSFLRAAIGEWARGRPEWADPDPAQLMAFLRPADIPYRERRLMFLLAGVCALYDDVGAGPHAPLRQDLDALKTAAWDLLDELRRIPGEVVTDVPPEAVAFLSPTELDDSLLADPRLFAEQHADDFATLFRAYRDALESALGDGGTPLWEIFQRTTQAWGPPTGARCCRATSRSRSGTGSSSRRSPCRSCPSSPPSASRSSARWPRPPSALRRTASCGASRCTTSAASPRPSGARTTTSGAAWTVSSSSCGSSTTRDRRHPPPPPPRRRRRRPGRWPVPAVRCSRPVCAPCSTPSRG
ncbi:hypothetical protein U6N30_17360 [Blastococcus brunescens]|uniref:Uncharacterized protein n=1 Tax=Blastococcus brunescens TaxID=1564165 RepID=A0ABZ1AWJ5_9ACTN|nr:hypothetical protein [Blastococcus sp. BMG 8361]WRL61876.1 hypothetical protein U6N30_17360 [Blastococcus sp. BMG 8361]